MPNFRILEFLKDFSITKSNLLHIYFIMRLL